MNKLFGDLKTDEEKSNFFLSGRGYETGVIAAAIQNDVAMAYHRCAEYKKELAALQAARTEAVQGDPVGWQCVWPCGGTYTTDSYESAKNYQEGAISSHGEDQAPFIRPLFAAPQPAEQQPECGCCGQTDRCDDDCDAVVIGGHRAAEQQPSVQKPVGFVSQDFLEGKWSLDHIAKSDEGQISRTIPVFAKPPQPAPDVAELVDALVACAKASSADEVGLIVDAALSAYHKGGE